MLYLGADTGAIFSNTRRGLVPAGGGSSSAQVLRGDQSWSAIASGEIYPLAATGLSDTAGTPAATDSLLTILGKIKKAAFTDFAESVDDRVAAIATAGTGLGISYNDAAGTLTFSVTGITASLVTDFSEAVDDRVAALLGAGAGIGLSYNDASGVLTISSSNSGKSLIFFPPEASEFSGANYATLDVRNGHPVLAFDTSTQETAIFTAVLPRQYGGNGLTVTLYWMAETATSGTIGWDVAFERMSAAGDDLDADSFATAKTVTAATVDATSGKVTVTSVAFSNSEIDGLLAGEMFRMRVRRDNPNDNAAGDAQLLGVEIRET